MATNVLAFQMEKVSAKLPRWFGKFDTVANLIHRKATIEKVGERDFRATYLTSDGGRPGTYNPNGGAFGRGSYQDGAVMITTYFPFRMTAEIPQLASRATAAAEQSRLQAFKELMKNLTPNFAAFVDRAWHNGDGTASLGQATAQATVSGNTVYTMNAARGVQGFRRGEYYNPYDTTLATIRAGGPYKCIAIDYPNRKVTMEGTVTAAAATDHLCFEGTSGASPAGLKGLLYHNNTATSGSTHGVNRATEPEMIPNMRDASGRPTFQMGTQIAHQIIKRRAIEKGLPKGLTMLCSPEQQANIRDNVMDMAHFDLSRGKLNADLMPTVDMNFNFAGVPAILDPHQATDRLDYIVPDEWSVAELDPVGFFEIEGRKYHALYGTDGSPAATVWFALYVMRDYLCHDFGHAAVIYNCTQPTYA